MYVYTPSGILLCLCHIIGTGALDRVIRLEEFQLRHGHVVRFNDFVGVQRIRRAIQRRNMDLCIDRFVDMFKDHHTSHDRGELHVALGCVQMYQYSLYRFDPSREIRMIRPRVVMLNVAQSLVLYIFCFTFCIIYYFCECEG